MNISRKDFLKGAATGAASLAVTSLLGGCAAKTVEKEPETVVVKEAELLHTAYVNPQSEDYRTNTKQLKTLFSPVTIGSITSSHRIVKSAAGSATYLKGLTDELLTYYVNLAKGGVELIYVESLAALSKPVDGELSEEALSFGKKMVEECGKYGAALGYQWSGFGMGENEMTIDQIHEKQRTAIEIAKGMKQMGFKAFEINAAGFNMPEHFLSRIHNTRTDEYGCTTLENRARFTTEIIEGIKKECGDDFVVQVLIDAIEENDNVANNPTIMTLDSMVTAPHSKVTTVEEGIAIAKLLEKAGADSLHLRVGPIGHHVAQFAPDLYFILNGIEGATGFGTQYDFKKHWQGMADGSKSGAGFLLDVAAMYKKNVTIPCGVVSYMDPAHAPDFFEDALAEGKVDFYLMTRPLTCDNEYIHKLKEGRIDEIAPCTRCLHCHIGSNEANAQAAYCRVNALTQRVMRENGPATYELPPIDKAKKVMVVGAGPAGLEAARIAAQRGHDVTVYEKKGYTGGLLDFAHMVKGPHENLMDLKNYLIRQCELAGVKIETGTEVDTAKVKEVNPDAVVLATGGLRQTLDVKGDVPVIEMDNFMFTEMGENVVVYGSNAQSFDAALWLTVHKKNVTIVSPNAVEEFDMQQSQHAMRMMTTALYSLGVKAYPKSSIVKSTKDEITILHEAGVEMTFKCDAVVNAADMLPNTELFDSIDAPEKYIIGDAKNPFNIALAIRDGNDVGRSL